MRLDGADDDGQGFVVVAAGVAAAAFSLIAP